TPRPTKTPGGPTRTPTPTIIPGSVPFVYVRSAGNDANDGKSPELAVQTLNKAIKLATSGTTVFVGPGHYSGEVVIHNVGSSEAFPVQFIADTKGTHTGDAPGAVELDAAGAVSSVVLENAPYVVVDGFTMSGATPQVLPKKLTASAIEVRVGADHSIIRN